MNTLQGGYNNLNIDYWTPDNTTARWPKPTTATVSNKGLLARYDGSYLKLRNITLGYNVSKFLATGCNARFYATVQNPIVITKYDGLDPEVNDGMDNNVYPRPITVLFGVNINF